MSIDFSEARTILIGSRNRGKVREIKAIFSDLTWTFVTPDDVPDLPDVEETGTTFMANAILKAQAYALASGFWTLADDSGLEVDALDGAPGVFSARYAGEDGDDAANNAKLIRELDGVPDEKRTARFRAAVVLHDGEQVVASGEGKIEGRILYEERGENGFGYDPLFLEPSRGVTTAELEPEMKNQISHRANALNALRRSLEEQG